MCVCVCVCGGGGGGGGGGLIVCGKQCGGVWSDKASGPLLVQFLCDAADKRELPACVHTCVHLHTLYSTSQSQSYTHKAQKTWLKPKPVCVCVCSAPHCSDSHTNKQRERITPPKLLRTQIQFPGKRQIQYVTVHETQKSLHPDLA